VEYGLGSNGDYWSTTLEEGFKNPDAVRFYKVHVAGEVLLLAANPNDPVVQVFEDIYKAAIKG
jgi:hypothetical protein